MFNTDDDDDDDKREHETHTLSLDSTDKKH